MLEPSVIWICSPIFVSRFATEAENKSHVSLNQSWYSFDNFVSSRPAVNNSLFRSFSSEMSALKFEGGISQFFPDPPFSPKRCLSKRVWKLLWLAMKPSISFLNFAFEMVAKSSERLKIILLHFLWLPLTLFHSSNFVYTNPVPLCLLVGQAGVDSLEAPSLLILNSKRYSEQHLETLSLSSKSWKLKWR